LEDLGDYFENQGNIKRPIAVTDMYKVIFPREWSMLRFRADIELERSMEIQHWLDNHSEVTHWAAVDDLNMSADFLSNHFLASNGSDSKPGLTNFVHTPRDYEGIKQSGVKDKIMKFLL
jgi:hypothetical protein